MGHGQAKCEGRRCGLSERVYKNEWPIQPVVKASPISDSKFQVEVRIVRRSGVVIIDRDVFRFVVICYYIKQGVFLQQNWLIHIINS